MSLKSRYEGGGSTVATLICFTFGVSQVVDCNEFIRGYSGQTEVAVKAAFEKYGADGKALFLDEAYRCMQQGPDGYGPVILDSLLLATNLEDICEPKYFVAILAGYEKQMKDLVLAHNAGIARRFTEFYLTPPSNEEYAKVP